MPIWTDFDQRVNQFVCSLYAELEDTKDRLRRALGVRPSNQLSQRLEETIVVFLVGEAAFRVHFDRKGEIVCFDTPELRTPWRLIYLFNRMDYQLDNGRHRALPVAGGLDPQAVLAEFVSYLFRRGAEVRYQVVLKPGQSLLDTVDFAATGDLRRPDAYWLQVPVTDEAAAA